MVLSDTGIRSHISAGNLSIDPYDADNIEPASVDLRLGSEFKKAQTGLVPENRLISLSDDSDEISWHNRDGSVVIEPDDFVLATTKERVELSNNLVAHVLGRSSLGRLGISIHQTAGYIDPGFAGEITLELSNHGPCPVELCADDRICQIVFEELSTPASEPYGHEGSQYQNQSGATPSGMSFD